MRDKFSSDENYIKYLEYLLSLQGNEIDRLADIIRALRK